MKTSQFIDIFEERPKQREKEEDLYKIKKLPYSKDDMKLLMKLLKSKPPRPSRVGWNRRAMFSGGGFGGAGSENGKDQRVTFKMSYNQNQTVHDKYLRTYMPQENKSQVTDKPVLFGMDTQEYEENKVPLHFKCIISPENPNVNLEVLASEFIKQMEVLTGYKLYWQGCIHNDTEHRHAHLCINGKDKNGKNVRFPKEMIRRTMRETLSYLTTQLVGERSEKEIELAQKNLIQAKRWTTIDGTLESYSGSISRHNLPPELESRLAFLSELKLAEKHDRYYTLKDSWKEVLVSTGRYNTFLEEYQKADGNLELYSGGDVHGICENVITFDKDEAWNDAVIVNDGKKRIYVPVWQLTKDNLVGAELDISGGTRALSRQIRSSDIHVKKKTEERRKNRNGRDGRL